MKRKNILTIFIAIESLILPYFGFTQSAYASIAPFEQLYITQFQSCQLWKLSQLYSCARYFTPNPHVDDLDWYGFMIKNIQDLLSATSEKQSDSLLLRRFSILIPDLHFNQPENDTSMAVAPFYIKATTLNTGFQKSATSSHVIKLTHNMLQLPQYLHVQLSPDLTASYSIVTKHVPQESEDLKRLKKESEYKWNKAFYTSPYYRLANAIITGAYIQHFYAYYEEDRLNETWENEMKNYLIQVASCTSYPEYLNLSYKHYSHVNDGHLFVMNSYYKPNALLGQYQPIYYPQIILDSTEEGSIYIKECPLECGVQRGDELLSVNGQNIKTLIAEKKKYVSAATEADRIGKVLDMFLFQSFKKDSIVQLKVQRVNQQECNYSIYINRSDNYLRTQEKFITQIEEGIWRINPCLEEGVNYKEFSQYIDLFNKAKGLIIDLRGYPNPCILPILSHFIDSTAMVGQILTPTFYAPNHQHVDYQITGNSVWGIHPSTEPYQKEWEYEKPVAVHIHTPVYFLTNREVLSFGETVVELIKHYKIGTIIGEPTSGTNGDAVILKSPSIGYIFTGYKFLNHDGSRHHGIGIQPDIICHQKTEDIQKLKDSFVKKACELINNRKVDNLLPKNSAISSFSSYNN